MNKQERLREFTTEANLREMLMTLFVKMGLDPILTHGADEHGRDIVCRETTNVLKVSEWIGCVVKLGPITGGTSGSGSLQTIANQVSEAFIHSYVDLKTKQKVKINKVYVITNDEILSTARDKIPEKASAISAANLHFVDNNSLIKWLDEHWNKFWDEPEGLLLGDIMNPEVGKILYVVALAFSNRGRRHKQKPSTLSRAEIIKQTGLSEHKVDSGLKYLIGRKYLAGPNGGHYALDPALTVGRLLTDPALIRLLFLLDKEANGTRNISLSTAKKAAKKKLNVQPDYVVKAMKIFVRGDYVLVDNSHGKKPHYNMNDAMLQEESAYLKFWLEHNGKIPQTKN